MAQARERESTNVERTSRCALSAGRPAGKFCFTKSPHRSTGSLVGGVFLRRAYQGEQGTHKSPTRNHGLCLLLVMYNQVLSLKNL